jgi:hypothetical protein
MLVVSSYDLYPALMVVHEYLMPEFYDLRVPRVYVRLTSVSWVIVVFTPNQVVDPFTASRWLSFFVLNCETCPTRLWFSNPVEHRVPSAGGR